jgi:hypothetical protein
LRPAGSAVKQKHTRSLGAQIVFIVLISMSAMLAFQAISMGSFISVNNQRRRDYITATSESIAASLDTIGENIHSMAIYMASFESFKNLYFPERNMKIAEDSADMVASVFQTVIYLLRKRIALPVSNLVKSMLTQDDKPLHTRLAHSNIDEIDHQCGTA